MAIKFKKLTRINIRKVHPGDKIQEHGICLERLTNGDGRYTVNIMVDGVRVHRVIGKESEGVTRKQALKRSARFRGKPKRTEGISLLSVR